VTRYATTSGRSLSLSMREMLWTIAQHKYGWTHVSRHGGELQVADALIRRELVEWGSHDRDHSSPIIVATEAGKAEIARLFPISPFVLGTYDWRAVRATHGEWTPPPSLQRAAA
jgi:peptidoglycan/xylan/chitin deacetylase (PgdA/CDA1 family)